MVKIMVKINNSQRRCPYCGYPKPLIKQTCPQCGNDLTSNKIKITKKLLKGSNILVRLMISKEYRDKTLNKIQNKKFTLNHFDITANNTQSNENYGYLLCDTCPIYYKLNKPISEYNNRKCGCGGNLIYSKKPRYD